MRPPHDRAPAYRGSLGHDALTSRPASIGFSPRGSLVHRAYDEMELVRLDGTVGVVHHPAPGDEARWPFIAIYALRAARLACSDGRSLELARGDCCILRTRAGLRVSAVAETDLLVVYVPADTLGPYERPLDEAEGRSHPTTRAAALLVGELLHGLSVQLESYQCSHPARLAHHVVGLLALMCTEAVSPEIGLRKRRLLTQAKEHIESNLGDVQLTPERIAAALHISSRTLHRLFESEGVTIGGWIRRRRLEHCRLDLADKALADVPVSHIGSRWGLWDAAHFSRLFKAAYGVSPRTYRLAHWKAPGSTVAVQATTAGVR